jgi:REP element-mobilizing transposase RayT
MAIVLRHRKSIRLKEYDYSQPGEYFITICSYEHECLFGEIVGEEIRLNENGKIVQEEWEKTAIIRKEIELDEYIVMPNHFHGIVVIKYESQILTNDPVGTHGRASLQRKPRSLGSLIAGFKSIVTKRINELHKTPGSPVWQPRYYDHIIRNEKEFTP